MKDPYHRPLAGMARELPHTMASGSSSQNDLDEAFDYLEEAKANLSMPHDESVNLRHLRRKIDLHLIPIMTACYTMQFLDKVVYNYAAVMGMPKDLGLKGNEYSNAATAFFGAYLGAEILNVAALQKLPPARWLSANVIVWGFACGATAGAQNYTTLVIARVFLGLFEAAIGPSLILISSQWYTKQEQILRFSIWYCGLGLGQIIGGILSYGFQQVKPGQAAIAGWQILFLVVGGLTIGVGLWTFLFLPDTPMTCRFLNGFEKVALLNHVSPNRTSIKNKHFVPSQLLSTLMDPQIWLLVMITVAISISSGIVTTYSTTLIKLFGYSSPNAALLNTPSGAVTIASTLFVGIGVRYNSLPRSLTFITCAITSLIGACLLAFVPSPTPAFHQTHQNNKPALLAGIYLVNAITPCLAILYSWTAANVSGSTKRVVVACLVSGSFGVGNIVSPQTFQAKDLPGGYKPAKVAVVATQAAAIGLTGVLVLWYWWSNRNKERGAVRSTLHRQDAGAVQQEDLDREKWENETDEKNSKFKYVY